MSRVVPLQVYPWPVSDEQMLVLREAKESLNIGTKVLPTEAVVGMHARVLALGSVPPWVCEVALVRDPSNAASVAGALDWLLNAPEGDERGITVPDRLSMIFGKPVRELPKPECHCGELRLVENYEIHSDCKECLRLGCNLTKGICFRD